MSDDEEDECTLKLKALACIARNALLGQSDVTVAASCLDEVIWICHSKTLDLRNKKLASIHNDSSRLELPNMEMLLAPLHSVIQEGLAVVKESKETTKVFESMLQLTGTSDQCAPVDLNPPYDPDAPLPTTEAGFGHLFEDSNAQKIIDLEKFVEVQKKLNPAVEIKKIAVTNRKEGRLDISVNVIRDDKLVAGTKQRALAAILLSSNAREFVYAGPVFGFAQIALAHCCQLCGKRGTTVVAEQRNRTLHPLTAFAESLGGKVIEVSPPNNLKEVQRRAEIYVQEKNERAPGTCELLPFGLHNEFFLSNLIDALKVSMPRELMLSHPKRLWLVAGSATLLAAFARLWPHTHFLVVQVGKKIWPDQLEGFKSTLYICQEAFWEIAKCQPPYPSVSNYDAKLWQFVLQHGEQGDYVWNVAADKSSRHGSFPRPHKKSRY